MTQALEMVAAGHNSLELTVTVPPTFEHFKVGINDAVRPYRVLNAGSYVEACKDAIANKAVSKLVPVGAIDQLAHVDDSLINFTSWPKRLEHIYKSEIAE